MTQMRGRDESRDHGPLESHSFSSTSRSTRRSWWAFLRDLCLVFGVLIATITASASAQSPTPPPGNPSSPSDNPFDDPDDVETEDWAEPGFPGGGDDVTPVPMEEWHKRQQPDERLTAYGPDLLGDAIDPHTGGLSFSHTDVSIPGNFDLPVATTSTRNAGWAYQRGVNVEFGDWELGVPQISVTVASGTP